jgi:DNA (cytosine-5)-methyltransferase 1
MNHASLFSGIGGFDVAAQWMGWHNLFSCEIDPFCNKILTHYWPDATHYRDIITTDFSVWRGRIDVLTGGFPCQPFSVAGQRAGSADARHLWPEMLRAIREIAPNWVVAENVPGLVSQAGGVVFDRVLSDLADQGYTTQVLNLPAASVGAPHQRERIWFVAYNGCQPHNSAQPNKTSHQIKRPADGFGRQAGNATHPENTERECPCHTRRGRPGSTNFSTEPWIDAATRLCSLHDGFPGGLDVSAIPRGWRAKSLKGYGNAIVPQVAYQIFQALEMSLHDNAGDGASEHINYGE